MNNPDPAQALDQDLPASLSIYPCQVDLLRDTVMLIRLSTRDFTEASFLDRRVIAQHGEGAWFTWEQIAERMSARLPGTAAHYIFHVGHCGSTLVSRLLGDLGVLALREPLPLRTLAEIHAELDAPECRWSRATFDARVALMSALFDRGEGPRAVKATSFCNDLAAPLLAAGSAHRATVVYTRLRPYLANVLVGPNSRLDLLSAAPLRLKRLIARTGGDPGRLSEMSQGVISGMSWATEMSTLAALLDAFGSSRVSLIDFDRFLDDVSAGLRALADQVAPGIPDHRIDAAVAGPSLTRYSKAPEYAYDGQLRQRVLADGERQFGEEIRSGVEWCERAASRFPAVARALDLFDRA